MPPSVVTIEFQSQATMLFNTQMKHAQKYKQFLLGEVPVHHHHHHKHDEDGSDKKKKETTTTDKPDVADESTDGDDEDEEAENKKDNMIDDDELDEVLNSNTENPEKKKSLVQDEV